MYVHVHCLTTSFSNEKLAHIHLVRRPAGTKALHILSRKNCADMDVGEALNMRVYAVYKLGVRIVQDV